jgi:hypothetical protein
MHHHPNNNVLAQAFLILNQIPERLPLSNSLPFIDACKFCSPSHTFTVEWCLDRSLSKVDEFSAVHAFIERYQVKAEYE